MKDETVDQEEFWIKWGPRILGLTFRSSRFAGRVPQLAALALYSARFTAYALQFAQGLVVFQYISIDNSFKHSLKTFIIIIFISTFQYISIDNSFKHSLKPFIIFIITFQYN